jgi:hypothetical protein
MSNQRSLTQLREEDCIKLIVNYLLSRPDRSPSLLPSYGYDLSA